MHIDTKTLVRDTIKTWNAILEQKSIELRRDLTEEEVSALAACLGDSIDSFVEIILALQKIANLDNLTTDEVHDEVAEIYWSLQHIKDHFVDAEKPFLKLIELLAK